MTYRANQTKALARGKFFAATQRLPPVRRLKPEIEDYGVGDRVAFATRH